MASFHKNSQKGTNKNSWFLSIILPSEILVTLFFWTVLFAQMLDLLKGPDIFFLPASHIFPIIFLLIEFWISRVVIKLKYLK